MRLPDGLTRDEYVNILRNIELQEWHEFLEAHCARCGDPLAVDGTCQLCEQEAEDELRYDA